jgi:ABC-type branched-subunit amino acid transport system ATPase component
VASGGGTSEQTSPARGNERRVEVVAVLGSNGAGKVIIIEAIE